MDTPPFTPLPALFLSHGSPMLALEPGESGDFLQRLGPAIDMVFGRPRAILAISAHSTARMPVLLAAATHREVHDFGGFPDALFRLQYRPPGAPALATETMALLSAADIPVQAIDEGGLDHGIWSMLRFMYPQADVPVLPLAWMPGQPVLAQFQLGEALAPLRERGVLIVATGSITHNLRRVFSEGQATLAAPEIPESRAFRDWIAERSAAGDWDALFDYRRQAPYAADMHPTDEYLLPWYIAAGSAGREWAPVRLHDGVTYGCLGMDAYTFGSGAPLLLTALEDDLNAKAR